MTLELWNTFATMGTFIVIAATAIAALVQLRHARGSNQLAALAELQDTSRTAQFEAAEHVVRTELEGKLKDPEFRYQLCHRSVRAPETRVFLSKINTVGNFYENMGLLVKSGLVDRDLALDTWAGQIPGNWERLSPFAVIIRRELGDSVWENFEYLTVLAQDWMTAHPDGAYPRGVRRIELNDSWLDDDKRYEAVRATA
jgi:hypothetical protein